MKDLYTCRRIGNVGFKDAFEFQQRFVIEGHIGEIFCLDFFLFKAIGDGIARGS